MNYQETEDNLIAQLREEFRRPVRPGAVKSDLRQLCEDLAPDLVYAIEQTARFSKPGMPCRYFEAGLEAMMLTVRAHREQERP